MAVDAHRAWASIPEVSDALKLNKQTLRNRCKRGEIRGALREPSGQRRWRIPGLWLAEQVKALTGRETLPRGVKIEKLRGGKMVPLTIWRSEEIAAEQAAIDQSTEVTVIE